MSSAVKHLFVLNPKSFWHKWKSDQVLGKIHDFFKEREPEQNNYEVYISRFPRDAVGFIPRFARGLPRGTTLRVYAVGGDGILFDCLNGVMGIPDVELAVIPYGYTNSFIRGFGDTNKTLFRDMGWLFTSPAVPVDVMRYGNRYALDYCIIGVEAEAIRRAAGLRERLNAGNIVNQWLYRQFYSVISAMESIPASLNRKLLYQQYTVDIDGVIFRDEYRSISVFNGSYYGGGLHPLDKALPNDGIVDILLARSQGFLRTFLTLPFYATGRYKQFPHDFTMRRGNKISIDSGAPLFICMDDVFFWDTQCTIELMPGAVRFVDASLKGYQGAGGADED